MKKTKIASFINLLMPFILLFASYLSTKFVTFNWGLLLLEIFAIVLCMAFFGLISLILNIAIIKNDGLGFVSFNLLILSLAEFVFGMICVYQVFWNN